MALTKKIINTCLLACFGILVSFQESSFKSNQLAYKRVKAAYTDHWKELRQLLELNMVNENAFDLYIRAFKEEDLLEAWVKNKNSKTYLLLKTFKICAKSGSAGPKRRQGDGQVPEGFYEITAFQPQSSYHLALKVGYPNKSDRIKALSGDPGGDIMIHGNCVTIGCIPLRDEPIEQLYILGVQAKNSGSVIYTDIYPFKFDPDNNAKLLAAEKPLQLFWKSLKTAYDYFELNHSLPKITTDAKGNYVVTNH